MSTVHVDKFQTATPISVTSLGAHCRSEPSDTIGTATAPQLFPSLTLDTSTVPGLSPLEPGILGSKLRNSREVTRAENEPLGLVLREYSTGKKSSAPAATKPTAATAASQRFIRAD